MIYKEIVDKVDSFKTKYKQGFIKSEIKELLKQFSGINMDKFNDALSGITCMSIDNNIVIYHCDIEKALLCGMNNRELGAYEFD